MIRTGAAALLLLLSGSVDHRPAEAAQGRLTVEHRRIIIRVPSAVTPASSRLAPATRWRESRGPSCIAGSRVVGATLPRQNSIDLILRDRTRVRARLHRRCPALDYYRGFYINATADGRICADRDSIRSRAGGECQIDAFRTLTPERP